MTILSSLTRPARAIATLALLVPWGLGLTACSSPDSSTAQDGSAAPRVELIPQPDRHRVAVRVAGEPFTAYVFEDSLEVLKKPVLYPIRTAGGTSVVRGHPIDPRPGERVDHPHHIGHWLNYGDVNGLDFWNNSSAVPEEERSEMGHIVHRQINALENGDGQATLGVRSAWQRPDGTTLLQEDTRFVFRADGDRRTIDRITRLTAVNRRVEMPDNKEGFVALRVRRELEHPADGPVEVVAPDGGTREVEDAEGVSGRYLNAHGVTGTSVWGRRSPWVLLEGIVEGDSVGVAILDHPSNVGHPTYWHARGYGLFAANPLGQSVFSEGEEELGYALQSGESLTVRYRILLLEGDVSAEDVEAEYAAWSETSP